MANQDYLPGADRDLLTWVTNFLKYLATMFLRINFPEDVYHQLSAHRNDFAAKLEIADDPSTRTKPTVQAKNTSRKTLVAAIRQAVKEYLTNNHLVTDADRDGLGLPVHKTTRTPAPVAVTYPGFDVDSSTIRRLTVHFYDQGNRAKAKPAGQHGVEIRWTISDTPVVNVDDLIHSSFDTRTPFTLEFTGDQRGKTVYFCLCWENTRGEKGPWSEIESAIIP